MRGGTMNITITAQSLITAAAVITAIATIGGAIFAVYRWYLGRKKDNVDISRIKEENCLICFALSACLDGLTQLGANHTVPIAKEKLDKYLNQQAHK